MRYRNQASPSVARPRASRLFLPLSMMAAIQALTGVPSPHYFHGTDSPRIVSAFSEAAFSVSPTLQNLSHVPLFAVLTCTVFWSLRRWFARRGSRLAWSVLIALAFALANESCQLWIPTRTFSGGDLLFNALGVLLALGGLRIASV